MFTLGGKRIKICYARPSSKGHIRIGGHAVPYGQLWSEPLVIITPVRFSLAGFDVPPGMFSMYIVPEETEWAFIFNRSVAPWDVTTRGQDVGSATVEREWTPKPVDTLTIRTEPVTDTSATVVLEWERTRLRIPVALSSTEADMIFHCVRFPPWIATLPPVGSCYPVRDRRP